MNKTTLILLKILNTAAFIIAAISLDMLNTIYESEVDQWQNVDEKESKVDGKHTVKNRQPKRSVKKDNTSTK